jgi:glycerol kinase
MQFQADITKIPVEVASVEELSALGAAYGAGIAAGVYDPQIFAQLRRQGYRAKMDEAKRRDLYSGWQAAVARARA